MKSIKIFVGAACAASSIFAVTPALASAPAAREACRQFIERSGYHVQEWGEYWNWTTIDNRDGTWSVGARFVGMPPGGGLRNLYVTCIAKKQSEDRWALEKLSQMQ